MKDLKLILGVVLGSGLLVVLMIWGLSKMSGPGSSVMASSEQLTQGATLSVQNGETKVEVVVFSDTQCPACKVADEWLKPFRSMEGVSYTLRYFPLVTIHKNAMISAQAVEAARQMGKGWEMMDLLFEKQDDWSEVSNPRSLFEEYVSGLGLNVEEFKTKIDSSEVKDVVQTDLNLANSLLLSGTPSIFVNGELVSTQFAEGKIKEALAK